MHPAQYDRLSEQQLGPLFSVLTDHMSGSINVITTNNVIIVALQWGLDG